MAGKAVGRRSVGVAATLLAGRVFTHRLGADEAVHDMLGVTPDLDPITTLCEHEEYGRLADGSAARIVLAGYDESCSNDGASRTRPSTPAGHCCWSRARWRRWGPPRGIWSVCG